jgi:carboxyl-terminal processing protease
LGDPYTVFLTPQQNKETKEELGGSFEGIGAQLGLKDKKIVVIAPLPETPAEKAGIKPGDWILSIDNKSTDNLTLPEAVSKIRGKRGTAVTLQVLHDKAVKPVEYKIVRDTIQVKSVTLEIKNNQPVNNSQAENKKSPLEIKNGSIAYVKLSRFGDDTDNEWDRVVTEIIDQGSKIKGLILDLRNNPGGYLNGAVYIASEFLKTGSTVVVQENADGSRQKYLVEREGKLLNMPLVVLINEGSASASEIVSGALLDYKRATLVGMKSFGKGSVQEAQDLSEGAGLHITTAKWLLPAGKWINGTGITPDIKVELDEKNPTKDLQLDKAIEVLSK